MTISGNRLSVWWTYNRAAPDHFEVHLYRETSSSPAAFFARQAMASNLRRADFTLTLAGRYRAYVAAASSPNNNRVIFRPSPNAVLFDPGG